MHNVAIIIPNYKSKLSAFEQIAIDRAFKVFKQYPIIFTLPNSEDETAYKTIAERHKATYHCIRFPDTDFKDTLTYSHLLVTKRFYNHFKAYDYILIYQTDCFVFEDKLSYWCAQNYDYIGAPFIIDFNKSKVDSPFFGVGNGGFSLRKVSSFLKVLNSFAYIRTPKELLSINKKKKGIGKLLAPLSLLKNLTIGNNTFHLFNDFYDHEDMFWGRFVNRKFPWFTVPSPEAAVPFSFDVQARKLYEINNFRLPFGCHAWWRFDLEFWKPFIEAHGYNLEKEANFIL